MDTSLTIWLLVLPTLWVAKFLRHDWHTTKKGEGSRRLIVELADNPNGAVA